MKIPFNIRNGIEINNIIYDDFPSESLIAVYTLMDKFVRDNYIKNGWVGLYNEICRSSRKEMEYLNYDDYDFCFKQVLYNTPWIKVFIFLERVYDSLLEDVCIYNEVDDISRIKLTKEEVKQDFAKEINNLLLEDNFGYEFVNGEFYRRGRAVTQDNIQKSGTVLSDARLDQVRIHYLKALKYFRKVDDPDYENTIKESICALEVTLEILTKKKVSKDFSQLIRTLEGNNIGQIPAPITQSLIKIYGYRNNGTGVSHGSESGLRVSQYEAELILNLVSTYITYFYDYYNSVLEEESVPF